MRFVSEQSLLMLLHSVIGNLGALGGDNDTKLGWLIGRPTMVSGLLAILTPLINKYAFAPLYQRYAEPRLLKTRKRYVPNVFIMIFVLCAFLSITGFGGTSVLYGSFMAGAFLAYLPSKHPSGPFIVSSHENPEANEADSIRNSPLAEESEIYPTFMRTFEKYFLDAVKYLLQTLFFASIGFAIPFTDLWTPTAFWRGLVYTILMLIGKVRLVLHSQAHRHLDLWLAECIQTESRNCIHEQVSSLVTLPRHVARCWYRHPGDDSNHPTCRYQYPPVLCRNLLACHASRIRHGCTRRNRSFDHSNWSQ
jgi:hypothetical protein